jgi:DTW domain-containing protein YfiP
MKARCALCKMHESLCICDLVTPIETRTRLVIVMHRAEARKSTNTGALAARCIARSEIIVRGHEERPSAFAANASTDAVLLFPHEDALPICELARSDRPITLVVPDGTWRQASKVRARVPGLRDIPCVRLAPDSRSTYRLRAESHDDRLSTIEAIARAMELLEGAHVRRALEHVFRAMVERTLWAKGALDDRDVTGGIPPGVMRHDPKSGIQPIREPPRPSRSASSASRRGS